MGSIKFNTNRSKVELTGITETKSSTLSGKGNQIPQKTIPIPQHSTRAFGGSGTVTKTEPKLSIPKSPSFVDEAFDTEETYIDKFKQGNIGGGIANVLGSTITAPQSIYLNAVNAIDSVIAGKGLSEFQYNMSKDMYDRAVVERRGETETVRDKLTAKNKALGSIYGLADEIFVDPLSLIDATGILAIKGMKTLGSKEYVKRILEQKPIELKSGKTATKIEDLTDDEIENISIAVKQLPEPKGESQMIKPNTVVSGEQLAGTKIDPLTGKQTTDFTKDMRFEGEPLQFKSQLSGTSPELIKGTLPTQAKIPFKPTKIVEKAEPKIPTKVAKAEPKVDTAKSEGLFVDYYPEKRAVDVTKSNDYHQITKEADYKPDDSITVYRGATDAQSKIADGDWVTTSKQLAKDYAGTGKVIEDKIAAKYLYASKGEGIEELIYSTKATKIPTKPKSVEAELKSLTAEMKVTPPTETQIKRYKQLKAQVKPAKIPTREPVSTVEPVKAAKPTLTPKTEKNIPNAVKTDNPYLNTITNVTEKTKAEKRLGENITFVNNKGNLTKATRKEYIEDMAMIDGSQIKTTQKLRTNGGKTFEVNEYRVYKTPNSKEPIKISKYEKDYFDFAKKNQDNVVQSVTPYKKPIKKVDKALPPKNTTNPIDLVMASSKKAQKGFKESVIDRGLEVKRKFVDSGDTVAIIGNITGDKGLYHSYNKARSSTRSAEHVLGEAQTNIIGDKVGESLKDIFKPIRKKGDGYYNDFQLYLLHKHNVDRMAQGKPVFGEDITANISITESNKLLKEYPEFEALSQKIYTFNKNNMQYRVDADLITAEQAKMFEEMYPHYVPTIRAKKSVPQPPKNSKTDVTGKIAKTIKEATGDSSPILPLHQSMARQTMQTVTAAEKNIFANRLIKNVTPETSRYIQDMNSIIKDFDLDSELVNAMKSKKESEELKNYFTLFRNGEAYQVKVDEGLFEGLEALTSSNRSTDAIIDAVTAGNTMFKQLITGYSPTFLVRNGARDLQDVGIYSKNLREFAIQYPKAIKEMTSNGELWQRYKALGGTGSSFFDYAKGFKKDPTFLRKNTLNKIENLNMAVEQLPRFTEFMATLSKGDGSYDNLLEALYNSADITVNFGRTGTWGKTLNQTFVPFFNPAMQGFDKLARTLKYTKGWKDWTKLTIKATALGITPALINELVYSDDPDYSNLYSRDKDINYLFKLDNNVWIRIPKGRVLSLIGGAAQRTVRLASGDNDAYAGFLKVAKEQVAPISPFESNIVSPILAVQNNKAWHGGTIEPQRLTGSAGLRYDESTTTPAKWLGAKLNYSPKKIDYLIDAYTGIIGDLAIPLTTPKAEVHPFAKAFTIDGTTTNRISQDFYDKKTEISESYSDNKDNTSYIQNRYLNKQSDMASELFEEIRTVQNSKLTDVQKRTKVREIRALINVIEKNALDSLPEVEKTTKKLVNKYPDTDDLYREVNRKVFGSEYALKLYNKTVYEKAQTYVTEKAAPSFNKNVATIPQKNGITWDNYYDGYFAQKDEASDISKAVALQGKNITTLYDAFGISDKNANIAAALSKNDLGKAYNTTYQKISDSEATKSAEKIAIIKQNNPTLSTSELRILYEAFNVAESIGGYTRKYN